jgi:hypothetical protein
LRNKKKQVPEIINRETVTDQFLLKIEQMVKQFKTHRCVFDFDKGVINSVIVMQAEDKVEQSSKCHQWWLYCCHPKVIEDNKSTKNKK